MWQTFKIVSGEFETEERAVWPHQAADAAFAKLQEYGPVRLGHMTSVASLNDPFDPLFFLTSGLAEKHGLALRVVQ